MSVRWFTSPDAAGAAEACAHYVLSILEGALAGQESATFAVSGGTTPKLLFENLQRSKLPWNRVHLFWVVERCVPPNDPASNYRLVEESLIRPAQIARQQVHRICGEMSPPAAAERYA